MAKVRRQVPHPDEIFELLKFKKPDLNLKHARLEKAQTIEDLRKIAKRRTPSAAFDYTDGAADDEISMNRARQAFKDVEFHPSILNDVTNVDTSCEIFGGPSALPFGIAPTGFTRLMQTEGELAGASAAGKAGIPFCLSTLGTTSIEDVKAANPHGRNMFQLYVMRQREISYGLVERAAKAGFDTLFFTVDTPVAWWWWDFITTPTLSFASLNSTGGTVGELLNAAMDPSIQFSDLEEIRSIWPGKLVVKGVQNVEDSKKLADLGVDGIILSNHGGRQLDRAPVPFHLVPEVVREVGKDLDVAMDTGIMHGADIVAALAVGAKFTFIGRAYLYGLMAGGEAGVAKTIEILSEQVRRTMQLLQVETIDELGPQHVTQLTRLAPRKLAKDTHVL